MLNGLGIVMSSTISGIKTIKPILKKTTTSYPKPFNTKKIPSWIFNDIL